jgi:hypothetical protein
MRGVYSPSTAGCHQALVARTLKQKALARWGDELVGKFGNKPNDRFATRGRTISQLTPFTLAENESTDAPTLPFQGS